MDNKIIKLKREDLLYPKLSYELIGVLFGVWNELGYGYQEKYYQKAVANTLRKIGLSLKEQVPIKIQKPENRNLLFRLLNRR